MGAIQVKNVPEDVHAAIRDRAADEGMSVGEYVLGVVRRDLALPTQRAWFADLASRDAAEGIDAARALSESRAEREESLASADSR